MTFSESIQTCFQKYATFTGRATRSEYWWFALFIIVVSIILTAVAGQAVSGIFSLLTLIPSIAVGIRRLHDLNRSGWFLLLALIPIIGSLVLIYWFAQVGVEPNQYD